MNLVNDTNAAATPQLGSDELAPGTSLSNGTYTIIQHLKTGGFGITYLANDTLGRRVVIKECFPSGMSLRHSKELRPRSRNFDQNVSGLIERFVAEAHCLAKVSHPSIVKVHQVFKENNTAYMALDYVEGHDLLEVMQNPSLALAPAGVRTALLKLLDAIYVIHENGLLHRDISPDNILIDAKRRPILIDFGAARDLDAQPAKAASTLNVVKDGYSPQELYLVGGGSQGPWSDLYSLATSFYHVISGVAPANSQARLAAMAASEPDPCVPLAGRFDAYDPAFLAAIDKAMSVLPRERIQSARQWMQAISESDGGKVVSMPSTEQSRLVTPMTRVTRMEAEAARKKIGPAAVVGGVATLCLIAVGVYLAMPGSNAASVARLPADVAATGVSARSAGAAEPAASEPTAVAPDLVKAETAAATPEVLSAVSPVEAMPSETTALTSNWTLRIPFSESDAAPTKVATTTKDVPEWLVPGLEIVAVNGTAISSIAEIASVLRQSEEPGEAPTVVATLSTISDTGAAIDRTLDLSVVYRVLLASGGEFQVSMNNGVWQNVVAALPENYSGEMRLGDLIVGHVGSGERLDGPNSLKQALEGDIIAGKGNTKLAVQQGGQMWVVTFPLPS